MKRLSVLVILLPLAIGVVKAQSSNTTAQIDSLNILYDQLERTSLSQGDSVANVALKLSRSAGYAQGEADALSNLGRVQIRQGNNKKAAEYLFEALKIYESLPSQQNEGKIALALVRLSGALYFQGDFERSLMCSQRAVTLAKKINHQDLLGIGYRMRGEVHRDRGALDSSLHYFTEAAKVFEKTKNLIHLANIYVDIGVNHYYKGDYHQAIFYNKKFYELARKLNLQTDYSIGLHNIGEFYYLLKSYDQALTFLDSAQYYGEKFNQYTVLQDTYKVKAKLYTALKHADSAALYFEKVMAIKDSIYNDTYQKEMASLQTEMDVYRHEAENKILLKEKSISRLYLNLAIAGLIAIVSILGLVLLRQRIRVQNGVKKKLEQEVTLRTAEIVEQKHVIEDINLKLQLSLNRAKVDPHFIFNVLNSIQHLVLEKKPAEASDHLARLSRLARYILEKSSLDEVTVKEEITMLEQYIKLEQLRLDNRFQYTITLNVPSDTKLPAMLIQPYVENAILHGLGTSSAENLRLDIAFFMQGDLLVVRVADNGRGRSAEKKANHNSIGSTLGQQRLEILSKLDHRSYEVSINDLNPEHGSQRGTVVTLYIPLRMEVAA